MKSTGAIEISMDHRTEIRGSNKYAKNNRPLGETLILIQERDKTILVHQPTSKIVSIGRSQQNDIQLKNPGFSRKTAEVILGPVPLLRKMGRTGLKDHEIVPIPKGKRLKISPYTLCLINPGDILVNSVRRKNEGKTSGRWLLVSLSAIILIGAPFYNFRRGSGMEGSKPAGHIGSTTEITHRGSEPSGSASREIVTQSGEIPDNLSQIEEPRKDKPTVKQTLPKKVPAKKGPEQISRSHLKNPGPTIPEAPGIPPKDLEKLINSAKQSINTGNPEQAGRIILPVLPYLTQDQRTRLVQTLDPCLYSVYQRAYLLRQYDRPASFAIIGQIVKSGLEILPTFEKARELYKSEKRVEAVVRSTRISPE